MSLAFHLVFKPSEQTAEVFGSERFTGATLDRLTHRCHFLEAKDESLRLRGRPQTAATDRGGVPRHRSLEQPAIPE